MLLATIASLLLAAPPAPPALHLLPELAEAAEAGGGPAAPVDPFRNGIHPFDLVVGSGVIAVATVVELVLGSPAILWSILDEATGNAAAVTNVFAIMLAVQLVLGPPSIAVIQAGIAGNRLAGSWLAGILLGYAIEAAAGVLLFISLSSLPAFWTFLSIAYGVHLLLMPLATSLGLHLDLGGHQARAPAPPAPPAAPPPPPAAPPTPAQVPLLRISF